MQETVLVASTRNRLRSNMLPIISKGRARASLKHCLLPVNLLAALVDQGGADSSILIYRSVAGANLAFPQYTSVKIAPVIWKWGEYRLDIWIAVKSKLRGKTPRK